MAATGYTAWAVTAGEQPTTAYWNILGTNDASFNTGTGFNDGILQARHFGSAVIPSSAMALSKTGPDAYGWSKKDFGVWQMYEQSFAFTTSLTANQQQTLYTVTIPVGVVDSSRVRIYTGYQGNWAATVTAGFDGDLTAWTSQSLNLHNSGSGTINIAGYVHVMMVTQ